MSISTLPYFLFLPVAVLAHYLLPKRLQNPALLALSLLFYCTNLPPATQGPLRRWLPLAVLAAATVVIYSCALAMEKKQRWRRALEWTGILFCLGLLVFFKYCNFFLPTLLRLPSFAALGLPLGISFYMFAGIGYLVDVARGNTPAERDFIAVAVFLCFFGTITSGPICRAGRLLPQLKAPRRWDAKRSGDGLRLLLTGFFKQVAVANVLGLYVNTVYGNLRSYTGLTLVLAAVCYAVQLYFEFSGYSEIAQGTGLLLGLELPANFKTPYFSTNFSGFWQRWHISLSSWLQDYLFMPLVWGRWTSHLPLVGRYFQNPPVLSSLAIVFFVSGFWHGSTWPFVVWGCLQALYRVGEELLHKYAGKPKKKQPPLIAWGKRVAVFWLWTASLVFFRVGYIDGCTVSDGFYALSHWVRGWSLQALAADTVSAIETGFYAKPVMVWGYLAYMALVLAVAFWMDGYQFFQNKDRPAALGFTHLAPLPRWGCYYALIGLVLLGFILQSGGYGGSVSMAYAGF